MSRYTVAATATVEWDNKSQAAWDSGTLRDDAAALNDRLFSITGVSSGLSAAGQPRRVALVLPDGVIEPVTPNVTQAGRVLLPLSVRGFNDGDDIAPFAFRIFREGDATYSE